MRHIADTFKDKFKQLIIKQVEFDVANLCALCADPENLDTFFEDVEDEDGGSTDKKLKINKV